MQYHNEQKLCKCTSSGLHISMHTKRNILIIRHMTDTHGSPNILSMWDGHIQHTGLTYCVHLTPLRILTKILIYYYFNIGRNVDKTVHTVSNNLNIWHT